MMKPLKEPEEPQISAVMALYDTPFNYLSKTVKSILSQTFSDFELIVVDDASSMPFEEYFKKFNDSRIKYIKLEKNSGAGNARNTGIKIAKGKYIAICDSDDIYFPKRFEIQKKFLDENEGISLVSGQYKRSNKNYISPILTNEDDIKMFLLFNSPIVNALAMFRKDDFKKHNLMYSTDKNFGEDYELWIDAMFSDIRMANIEKPLMIYTKRKGQLAKEKIYNQQNILKEIYKKYLQKAGIKPSEKELQLHLDIYNENFKDMCFEDLKRWLDKLSQAFTVTDYYKSKIIDKFNKVKDRKFKIKIGNYNLILTKSYNICIQDRNKLI